MNFNLKSLKNQETQNRIIQGIFLVSCTYFYFDAFIATSYITLPGNGFLFTTLSPSVIALVMAMTAFIQLRDITRISKSPQKSKREIAGILLKLFALAIAYIYWLQDEMSNESTGIMLMLMWGLSAKELNVGRPLQIFFIIGTATVLVGFFLSMLGLIPNHAGNSFGFIYRTDYACHLLFLLLIYCFYHDGNLSPAGELGILALTAYNFFFVGGKTADVCMSLAVFATYWRHYRRAGKVPFQECCVEIALLFKVLYFPVILIDRLLGQFIKPSFKRAGSRFCLFSFPIFAVLIIFATLMYYHIPMSWITAIPKLGSFWARLQLGVVGFDIYPLKLFGNYVISRGNGGATEAVRFYYFLDSSYIKLLIEYGLIAFFLTLGMATVLQLRLYKHKEFYRLFLLALVALDCVMEHHLTDISYNVFFTVMLADFTPVGSEQSIWCFEFLKRCRKERSRKHKKAEKIALRAYIIISLILTIPAITTAYHITIWSGYTPQTETVLLVPGSYIDGSISEKTKDRWNELRVKRASVYLSSHSDAVCILSGTEDERETARTTLEQDGIDPGRIYTDESSINLIEALHYADELIKQEGLTNRKTVCTFKLQQYRVSSIAKESKTPVNPFNVPLTGTEYYRCFLNEQIQLIKLQIQNTFA